MQRQKELPKIYDPKATEPKIYNLWVKSGFFNPDKLPKRNKKPFTITIPPPNVTGELHMGHTLQHIIHDIIIRKKRMEGYKTLMLPGTDHAGIATQNKVEQRLRKEGKTRFDLGREKFIEEVWKWKEQYGNIILSQLKRLGSSLDWSRIRFTMDKEYTKAVEESFAHYYNKGWIYRGKRTINWCPRCATGLSDLEVEYKEEKGKFYSITYGPLTVGTARPETKLGDTALAVNPKDERYKQYVGKEITIQSVDPSIPADQPPKLKGIKIGVVADEAADPQFGTGVIKVTPAHALTDFEIYQRHPEIPILQVIGEDGRMTDQAGTRYQGLKVPEARDQIVKDLTELGLIDKIEDYTHNVAVCYRCGDVLEPILSKQWFLKMDELAKLAITAVRKGEIRFVPKRWEKIYFGWLSNIHDWCISRQLWWGHQIPVWYCGDSEEPPERKTALDDDSEDAERGCGQIVFSSHRPKQCPACKGTKLTHDPDVLDTWFSSALWPFATLGWPSACDNTRQPCNPRRGSDLNKFYPTDVLITDRHIINLWVARMVFSSYEFMGKKPFGDVFIHATVLAKDGQRMSKSLGTGVDPIKLIDTYGADATRFGMIYQAMGGQDIRFAEDHIIAGKKFCNKLWNITRFVLLQSGNPKSQIPNPKQISNSKSQTAADKKILAQLGKTAKIVDRDIEEYQFGHAAHTLYDFVWHDFADIYIERSKKQIASAKNQKEAERTRNILLYVLTETLKLLHPFIPFITEEIYGTLPLKRKKMLMVETWPVDITP